MSVKPEAELSLSRLLWKNTFNVKYLEHDERYDDGVNGSRIGNHPCQFSLLPYAGWEMLGTKGSMAHSIYG